MQLLRDNGYELGNCDITIAAERPKLNPHIPAMQAELACCMDCEPSQVSIKATTTERLGFVGRGEGCEVWASVTVIKP